MIHGVSIRMDLRGIEWPQVGIPKFVCFTRLTKVYLW